MSDVENLAKWVSDIDDELKKHTLAEVRFEARIEQIERDLAEIGAKLDAVLEIVTKAKGIWGFVGWVAGAVATVVGAFAFLVDKR